MRALAVALLLLVGACGDPPAASTSERELSSGDTSEVSSAGGREVASGDASGVSPAGGREVAFVALGGETFTLALALDPATRQRGLSGRGALPRNEGMLFVLPTPGPFAMVMRDCPAPIDVAFLDADGRVVSLHEMAVEPPRRAGESSLEYEARLPVYPSGAPVQFAIETAGGRLRELGLARGSRVALDRAELVRRSR